MLKAKLFSGAVTDADASSSQLLRYVRDFSVQVNCSNHSSINASVKLQASNDDTNWIDISGATSNITGNDKVMFDVADAGYKYVRALFAVTSGTVDADVIIVGKEDSK